MAMHVANETYLTLHDPRHNLLSIADSTGTVAAGDSLRYEPFGTPSVGVTASGIEPRFGGMRYLPGTQLYLSDTRLMDPRHGAWLSPDPLGYVDSPNLYAYARQNPIDFIDPSGLGSEKGKTGGNSDGGDIFDWLKGAKETLTEGIEGLLEATEDSFNFYKGLVTSDEFVGFWQGFGKRSLEIAGVGMFSMGVRTPWTTQMYVREGQQSWEGMKAGAELFTTAWDASWGDESAELRRQEMVGAIVNNFATMSPEEWGSMAPDLLLGVGTGGAGVAVGRGVVATSRRASRLFSALPGRRVRFFSVQGPEDVARLRSGGAPWPTATERAHLGEGLYAWGTKENAQGYLGLKQSRGVENLEILETSMSRFSYRRLSKLDFNDFSSDVQSQLFNRYSRFAKGEPHGFDHIIRPTNLGDEMYFSPRAFKKMRIE